MSADLIPAAAAHLRQEAEDEYRCNYSDAERAKDLAVAALLEAIDAAGWDFMPGWKRIEAVKAAAGAVAAVVVPTTEEKR